MYILQLRSHLDAKDELHGIRQRHKRFLLGKSLINKFRQCKATCVSSALNIFSVTNSQKYIMCESLPIVKGGLTQRIVVHKGKLDTLQLANIYSSRKDT